MEDIIVIIQQWVPINILVGLTAASVIGFIGSLIAIPWILIRLPSDYFDMRVPRYWMKDHHPVLRTIGLIVKNIAGSIFLIAGFLMLFLPGQGLLTMLIGISFMDFPNKRKLEARIVGQPVFFKAINAMRQKFNKLPLTLSPSSD
ncbi:MAG: PGPGW domain-containing protein [Nitrosomonas sp.]|uniref:PGPGW domain-containing protein n=1 Tax=Nitrosomonas sp. TaxID=42353 RepID=UPI00273175AC|nr:PGPGW domain-containing protein [Nitrosomonas sp.]MDP1549790.1 PGPGW domain-containing protein [Nitrosomonas sp.]MDP1935185.1 PGPGW domain-containing protein [Nitrosomonas sp.]